MQEFIICQSDRSSIIPSTFILFFLIFVGSTSFSQEIFENSILKTTLNTIDNDVESQEAISLYLKSANDASNVSKYRFRKNCFILGSALSFLAAGGCRLNANLWYQAYQRAITVEEANSWHKKVHGYDVAAKTLLGIGIASLVPACIYHKKIKMELNAGISTVFEGGLVTLRFTF